MSKTRLYLLMIFGLVTLFACTPLASSSPRPSLTLNPPKVDGIHVVKVPVLKVIDGDTVSVQMNGAPVTVRFLLIDTPETHHPKLGIQPYGPEASQETHRLLNHQDVILELAKGQRKDRYGRLLGYIFTLNQSVEVDLLEKGLARVAYISPPNTNHLDVYQKAEDYAKRRHLGVWKIKGYAREDGFHPEVMPHT